MLLPAGFEGLLIQAMAERAGYDLEVSPGICQLRVFGMLPSVPAAAVASANHAAPMRSCPAPSPRAHPACPALATEQIVPLETLEERLAAVINGTVDASINSERVLRALAATGKHRAS